MNEKLISLYGEENLKEQEERYEKAAAAFRDAFACDAKIAVSAPGRTEICGNHLDHQRGCIIAASVDADIVALACERDDYEVHLVSEGHGPVECNLASLAPDEKEYGTSKALVRGMAFEISKLTKKNIRGFNAYVTGNVPAGSGISSSAAFEVLLGYLILRLNGYSEEDISDDMVIQIAIAGMNAENKFFGKPSGLMDQLACAVGGAIYVDFENAEEPLVKKIKTPDGLKEYDLCLTDTGSSHEDLVDDYASIREDMNSVAHLFGKTVLREVDEDAFYNEAAKLRKECGDRAMLRAMHYFDEFKRTNEACKAMDEGDVKTFLELINDSGNSSYKLLHNIYPQGAGKERSVALALALSQKALKGCGASRVHGGGFAGTIQAYVPKEMTKEYKAEMDSVFGEGACRIYRIRKEGLTTIRQLSEH